MLQARTKFELDLEYNEEDIEHHTAHLNEDERDEVISAIYALSSYRTVQHTFEDIENAHEKWFELSGTEINNETGDPYISNTAKVRYRGTAWITLD